MTHSPARRMFLLGPEQKMAQSSRSLDRGKPEKLLPDRISDKNTLPPCTPDSLPSDQVKTTTTTRRFLPERVEIPVRITTDSYEEARESSRGEDQQVKENATSGIGQISRDGEHRAHSPVPEPLETAMKSPTRYALQPVDTCIRRNRNRQDEEEDEKKPLPTRRRFAPEPVEMSTKSSRRKPVETNEETKASPTRRRLAPESPDNTTRSNCSKRAEAEIESHSQRTRRKCDSEPVQISVRSRRKQAIEAEPDSPSPDETTATRSFHGTDTTRKFSPELIETARGSYRKGDNSPRLSRSQASDHPTDHPTAMPRYLRPPFAPSKNQSHSYEEVPQIHESRFSAASLARRQTRQHSFLVPELPCIESNSSEENSPVPSLSTSPSASSEESTNRQRKKDIRRSHDGNFRGYMLSLAAQAAEKQLIDQAMAAYPNEQVHEPVQHFAVEDSDEESFSGKLEAANGRDPKIFRRESGADLDWHMKEMRRHHAQLEDAKRALNEDTAGQSRFSAAALSARQKTHAKKGIRENQKGVGLTEMRNAASPPMLGDDLLFPMSTSPKLTRCDVDQFPVPRTHKHEGDEDETGEPKLWSANIGLQNNLEAGLWMGFCQKKDCDEHSPPTPMKSGLMTPAMQVDNPKEALELNYGRGFAKQDLSYLLATPCIQQNDPFTQSIDDKLNEELSIEQRIEEEFHHGFITQIYNYLSLGYPSLAHKFDHELSKITRIPVEELRKDDDLADAKGYVGAPEGEGLDEDAAKDGKCARWTALRLYIHEWARQQPGMADRLPNEWGVRARRGSWAI